ncbi:MAG: tyrosine-protein phosphatase, partial [Gammaproteobacteria bacterium]
PSRLPAATRIASIAITPGSQSGFFERIAAGEAGEAEMVAFMEAINRDFARHHAAEYRRMFEELLALEEGAFMINCAAGKDRTGFGAALILAALGVAEEDILADYMLTRDYFPIDREMERVRRKYVPAGGRFDTALMRPMMEVRESYLGSALAEIRARHESLERYLANAIGLGPAELARLRERLTD